MNWESSKLNSYLLGNVSEEERAVFDLQLLTSREFLTVIEAAEEELIDDYLDELLTADETARFERYFLNSPERIEQIEFARQLKQQIKQTASQSVFNQPPKNVATGYLNKLKDKYSFLLRPALAVPSLAALLLVLLGASYLIWQNRTVPDYSLAETELAQINRIDLSDLSAYSSSTKLTLVPGVARASSESKNLSLKDASELVFVRLALPQGATAESVDVKVYRDEQPEFNLKNTKVYSTRTGREVRLLLPRARLNVGSYQIKAVGIELNYVFEVAP